MGCGIVLALVSAVLPLILQRIIDATTPADSGNPLLYLYIPLSLLVSAPVTFVLRERLIDRYMQQFRQKAFTQGLGQDIAFYEERDSAVVMTQMSKGVQSSGRLMTVLSNSGLLIDIPLALSAAFYIGSHSLKALALLVVFLIIFVITARRFGGQLSRTERLFQTIDTDLTAKQQESIYHVATVRAHNSSDLITRYTYREGMTALQLQNRATWLYSVFQLLGQDGHRVAEAIILVTFLGQLHNHTLSYGTFMALSMYAGYVVSPADYVGTIYATVKRAWANIVPLHALLSVVPKVTESEHPLTLPPVRNEIEFKGVTFHYENGVQGVLKDFNLTIPAGKTTALVGRSGSGKTTLGRLLTRLYDPAHGVVLFDGTDIRHMSRASISEQISYLSQDVPIFSGTIAYNVGYGREHYTDEEVVAALRKAAADFVFDLEFGIHTQIGESGKRLSGGQQQRIVIARLFMGNPSVLVLDEATSALDTKTEREVTAAFDTLAQQTTGLTTIVIAHRLSTIKHADQIVVIDGGRVIAKGTHEQLQTCCTLYQELCGELAAAA
jgi:ABC-type multidrug transport system fused ATPase/permease subunit